MVKFVELAQRSSSAVLAHDFWIFGFHEFWIARFLFFSGVSGFSLFLDFLDFWISGWSGLHTLVVFLWLPEFEDC